MIINKRDFQLANGEIIPVGMNFRALELMSQYPGGLDKLRGNMILVIGADDDQGMSEAHLSVALHAMAYMLFALIRAGGTVCTVDECSMAIGLEDFTGLLEIFEEYKEIAEKMNASKNAPRRVPSTSRG